MTTTQIVQKVWNYCNTLRDDGVSYGDYLTQLTYLLFLKMADEFSKPPYKRDIGIPEEYNQNFLQNKPASKNPWTKELWIYDLRTNKHFTLKTNPLTRTDLDDFVKCYNPDNRFERQETERFKRFSYDELVARDKTSLDIFWLKDESLSDLENLPEPDQLAEEKIENIEAGLNSFKAVLNGLNGE